eukprot:CAMPEP_0168367714 /NCGR_PEP_ID=MMETSP0228-20121227/5880_1 /TAXON_ID=133427 /ORGANISM="Protoceratium reticulatum, Strain CCCM 535 (=CCMP 1889)" /LENGTH=422 /DNA_ID=CAMNT_0008380543 /DNA_START=236 /DNA_END=1503 /DNA_ORIENTATION=+
MATASGQVRQAGQSAAAAASALAPAAATQLPYCPNPAGVAATNSAHNLGGIPGAGDKSVAASLETWNAATLPAYPHLPIAFATDFTQCQAPPVSKATRSAARPTWAACGAGGGDGCKDPMPCQTAPSPEHCGSSESPDLSNEAFRAKVSKNDHSPGTSQAAGTSHGAARPSPELEEWPAGVTSLMLRNIPNRYTPEELLDEMVQQGLEGAFDFFYLPTDFGTKKNKGYGFVNLRSPALAEIFRQTFAYRRLTKYVTRKVVEVLPAVTQGFEAHVLKYIKHQGGRVQNPWFRPMIFIRNEGGSSPWRCLPLSEEHLPDRLRRTIAAAPGDAPPRLAASFGLATPPGLAAPREADLDSDPESPEAGDASDAEAAAAMAAAVSHFLHECGHPSQEATHAAAARPAPKLNRGTARRRRRVAEAASK